MILINFLFYYPRPEEIATVLVQDLELPQYYSKVISLEIRKEIRTYLFNLVSTIQDKKELYLEIEKNNTSQLFNSINKRSENAGIGNRVKFGVINKSESSLLKDSTINKIMSSSLVNELDNYIESCITNKNNKHHKPHFFKNTYNKTESNTNRKETLTSNFNVNNTKNSGKNIDSEDNTKTNVILNTNNTNNLNSSRIMVNKNNKVPFINLENNNIFSNLNKDKSTSNNKNSHNSKSSLKSNKQKSLFYDDECNTLLIDKSIIDENDIFNIVINKDRVFDINEMTEDENNLNLIFKSKIKPSLNNDTNISIFDLKNNTEEAEVEDSNINNDNEYIDDNNNDLSLKENSLNIACSNNISNNSNSEDKSLRENGLLKEGILLNKPNIENENSKYSININSLSKSGIQESSNISFLKNKTHLVHSNGKSNKNGNSELYLDSINNYN